MPIVNIEPTEEYDVPYDESDEAATTFMDELAVLGNTAELQVELGAPLEVTEEDAEREKQLLEAALKSKKIESFQTPNTAFAAAGFLRTYGSQLALDVATARAAITHKLMEIANCGDPKFELKALELLGKITDVGLFTEKSEVTVNHRSSQELVTSLRAKIQKLMYPQDVEDAQVVEVKGEAINVDEELGIEEEKPDADASDASE